MTVSGLKTHIENVTILMVSSVWRSRDFDETSLWLNTLPASQRRAWMLGVPALLAVLAFVAAAFGPEGLALYFVAIFLLSR